MKAVAYYRVSTKRQGDSGLGLDAQRRAVEQFVRARNAELINSFTEVESGRNDNRPQLAKALHMARITGATLVAAKLDRIGRRAAHLLSLIDNSGVKFVAADMPEANETTVGIMAVIAQDESRRISERTKAAMAAAKANGRTFGNPNGARALRMAGTTNVKAVVKIKANADAHAKALVPVLEALHEGGITSLGAIADALNARGILTRRGGKWHKSTVRNLLERLGWRD
jgi:DNA invertase Pin-like site-specific DNA recombinase